MDTLTIQHDGRTVACLPVELGGKKQARLRKNASLEIWRRLVQYVNADLKERAEQQNFRDLVQRCMAWNGFVAIPEGEGSLETRLTALVATTKRGRGMRVINRETFDLCRDVRAGLSVESGAKRFQVDFELVLRWLAHHEAEVGIKALRFLSDESENISLSLAVCRDPELAFYTQKVTEYGSIASAICKFILDRLGYYTEADDKRGIIPLRDCEMCGKIMVFEKVNKKTCGNNCRVSKCRKGL